MRLINDQRGASHIVAILAVVVIAAVGVVGYRVMNNDKTSTETATTSQSSNDPATIESKADVVKADKQLDSTSLNDVDPSQLDGDINSVL